MGAGMLVAAAVGFCLLTRISVHRGLTVLIAGSIIYSSGSLRWSSSPPTSSSAVPRSERAGAASAISETSAELGGALGIAIFGSIGTAVYRLAMWESAAGNVPPGDMEAARSTLGGAVAVAEPAARPRAVPSCWARRVRRSLMRSS